MHQQTYCNLKSNHCDTITPREELYKQLSSHTRHAINDVILFSPTKQEGSNCEAPQLGATLDICCVKEDCNDAPEQVQCEQDVVDDDILCATRVGQDASRPCGHVARTALCHDSSRWPLPRGFSLDALAALIRFGLRFDVRQKKCRSPVRTVRNS